MVSRPDPGRSVSEALCPDCVFPYSQAPGRGLRILEQPPRSLAGGLAEGPLHPEVLREVQREQIKSRLMWRPVSFVVSWPESRSEFEPVRKIEKPYRCGTC